MTAGSLEPYAIIPISAPAPAVLLDFRTTGAGTISRAVSNFRDKRVISFSQTSGLSEYVPSSLCPVPRVKYAAFGWFVQGRVQ